MPRRSRFLLAAASLCLAVAGVLVGSTTLLQLVPAGAAGPGATERVSVDSAGVQGNSYSGYSQSISADGRYVAFVSGASNLVPGDTNGRSDVFVRDRVTGATERVSVDSAGAQGNSDSVSPSISADGRYVAFSSIASSLVPGDTNDTSDVFVHDRVAGATERVSVDNAGAQATGDSGWPSVSADGRYVAFTSLANLALGDTNSIDDVFVHDRVTGLTERVSVDSAGVQGNNKSAGPSISADGRYVAFSSAASNLVAGDTNGSWDVFVRDRVTGATERVSVDSAGAQGNQPSEGPSTSADGRYVAFWSYAANLVAGDTNYVGDVFVRDRVTGTTERVSVDSAGVQGNGHSYLPAISGDGRRVAFEAFASNLAPGDTNGFEDVFVRDRVTGATERVSVDSAGVQGNSSSAYASISGDGRYVAFSSSATNLVPGDTNGAQDVFVRDRCPDGSCVGTPTITPTITNTPTPTATATPQPPVVVLVHGYDFNAPNPSCGMEPLATFIAAPTNTAGVRFQVDCQNYRTGPGVIAGAEELQRKVNGWGSRNVDIVAHSMGGLVARYYIEKMGGAAHVRSLTMLGTPNWGTPMGVPPCAFAWFTHDWAACDLVPFSPRILDLNVPPGSHAGVTYTVLMGTLGLNPLLLPAVNDCVVTVASAIGLLFPTELYPVLHVKGGFGKEAIAGCLIGNGEIDDPTVQARVARILLQANGFAAPLLSGALVAVVATPTSTPTAIPAALAPSTIASKSGVIALAQTFDLPVGIPAAQTTGTFIFRAPADPSASLTFTLLRPGGTPVATTDADVTYETGAGFGGLTETHYIIANPAAGTWTMRVTGATVPPTGWPYDLQALVPGGISVTAKAGAGHYDVGQPFALSADVAVNATPYAGATVSATITKPDNTTATLALTDIGGGAYTGSFSDTAACGLYQVTITAGGIDSGTPFSRQDRTVAFAGVPGNVILNPCVADSDGDGLTDAQEINIYHSNPANPYTAGDGYTDGEHVALAKDPTKYCTIMRADVDHDGAVSILDFVRVAQYFAQTIPPAPARYDQDGDNKISVLDFVKMAQDFIKPVTACP